ncbi:MAG TPA: hypothetical protein VKN18_05555 [Blastocatellia bacterium]|nr:hypothetical protein [Blastocatellia bacterium]
MTSQLLLLATCVYLAGMVLVTYFTRASGRRFLGALAGGLAVAIVGVGVEVLAHSVGLWHYSSVERSYGPRLMYPVIVLMWAGYSLVGWRVMRRFARRGLMVFLVAVTVLGTLRDYLIADKAMGFITLSPGIATILVDGVCWAGLTALALVVMRLIAGPASSDRLSSRRWRSPKHVQI